MSPRRASAPVVIDGPYRPAQPLRDLVIAVLLVLGSLGAVHLIAVALEAAP